jgi:hypothetical protein
VDGGLDEPIRESATQTQLHGLHAARNRAFNLGDALAVEALVLAGRVSARNEQPEELEVKRRGFLGLLGMAPAAPLIAKELAKEPTPAPTHIVSVDTAASDMRPVVYDMRDNVFYGTAGYAITLTACVATAASPFTAKRR